MKKLIVIVFAVIAPILVFAQVMDDSSIKKLESGEYSLEEGKIQVTFSDTVSPDYVQEEFDKMGLKILSSNFQPIILKIENSPATELMKELEDSEWVDFIMSESAGISDEDISELSEKDTLDNNRVNQMLAQLNHSGEYKFVIIGLTYNATISEVAEIKSKFPDLDIQVLEYSERTAIIQTEAEKEMETMDELKKLAYVKNTAFIGSLE